MFNVASTHFLSEFGTKGRVHLNTPGRATYSQAPNKYYQKVEVVSVTYKEGNSKGSLLYFLC